MSDETIQTQGETAAPEAETTQPPSETPPAEVVAKADGSVEEIRTLPGNLHPAETQALRDAKPGDAVNVGDVAAAIEYLNAGYANPNVTVCNKMGVKHWPRPEGASESSEPAFEPVVPKARTKPAAIVGEKPAAAEPESAPVNTPRHASVEAKPRGKPPAQ